MKTKKKVAKKAASKKVVKKSPQKKSSKKVAAPVKHEIVVRVEQQSPVVPTTTDLAEPMTDGKKLTLPKTWISDGQIMKMVQRTPREHVYRRKGKGGQEFDYVTGSYIEKVLNFVFGWNWDFEVVNHGKEGAHLWVLGKLTVRNPEGTMAIVKTQFGRAEIKMLRDKSGMVDFGNDLKSATTDALKKCASLLGIASDIYGKADYKNETNRDPRDDQPKSDPVREYDDVPVIKPGDVTPRIPADDLICHGVSKSGCGNDITPSEYEFSKKMFGKPLCRECQKDAKPKNR